MKDDGVHAIGEARIEPSINAIYETDANLYLLAKLPGLKIRVSDRFGERTRDRRDDARF